MRKTIALALALAGLGAAAPRRGPDYQPLEKAKVMARESLKGIAVYSTTPPGGGDDKTNTVNADWSINESVKLPGHHDWIWVKCGDIKTAREIHVGEPPELHFFDCDFRKICSTSISDLGSVESALASAAERYSAREIGWGDVEEGFLAAAKKEGRLVLLAFTNDRADCATTLGNLGHRGLASRHERFVFLKTEYVKGSEEAKTWNVMGAPTLLVLDPSRDPGKQVLERLTGSQGPKALKKFIDAALAKAQAKASGAK